LVVDDFFAAGFLAGVVVVPPLWLEAAPALLPLELVDFLLLPQPATPAAARATTARPAIARCWIAVIARGYAARTAADRIA
jgi:hypothetical protein